MGSWEDDTGNVWSAMADLGEEVYRERFRCMVSHLHMSYPRAPALHNWPHLKGNVWARSLKRLFKLLGMGSNVNPIHRLINLDQLDVNFWKINNIFWHLTSKQCTETHSLTSEDFALEVLFQRYDVMMTLWYIVIMITMLYCSALNAQNFESRERTYSINKYILIHKKPNTIHMYSGITSGRVLNGELLYTKILEVNLFAFAYRLFRRDFSPLDGTYCLGTHSFLQPYMHFLLIWEGFMNGQSWSILF